MTLSFTACSSSDDDGGKGKIERPKYLSDAARYKITTQGSTWKSLELTEDGRYFNVSSTNSEQCKLCVNGPLYIDARLFWKQAIGSNCS